MMPTTKSPCPRCLPFLLAALALAGLAANAPAADWPAYGRDARRGAATDDALSFPLRLAWEYRCAQPPTPAWPEPVVEMHRMDFDFAFQPVVARGLVIFASSADDTVRALDLETGALRWRFTAGGPVRFAPQVEGDRCYLSSDDGVVHCLAADTGAPVWSFRAALNERQVPGNGRMISRWPCRSGLAVDRGAVYVAAGMWPAEGVLVYALNARDGSVIWCNDTSGGMFMSYPHGGATAIGGVAPQGYILASDDALLIPTGRSVPAAFDRRTGRFLYLRTAENRADGSWWGVVYGDSFYGRTHANKWDMGGPVERFGPRPGDGMKRYSLASGEALDALPGRHFVVPAAGVIYAAGNGIVEAVRTGDAGWQAKHPRVYALALAGNALLAGSTGAVTAFRLDSGAVAWRGAVDGEPRGLAIAAGRVVAATHRGVIACFAPPGGPGDAPAARAESTNATDIAWAGADAALPGVDFSRLNAGYALVLGDRDDAITATLLRRTGLHVIRPAADAAEADAARSRFLEKTALYGRRVSVPLLADQPSFPYPDFFANLIVIAGPAPKLKPAELYRMLRPCGGRLVFPGVGAAAARTLLSDAGVPARELRTTESHPMALRGKLEGALDWDSEVRSDERLTWPLELTWFGGPGPDRMPSRHGAVLPAPANGRYFAVGDNHLIAVDAYNGAELWSQRIPDLLAKLGVVSADDDTVYVNFGATCRTFDAQTGAEKRRYAKQKTPGDADDVGAWDELPPQAHASLAFPTTAPGGTRAHPLSGGESPLAYRRAYGCGSMISSATMHFFRSATFGMYDLEDDSGIRNFSGARPACALSMIPALGLLIANEGSGGCVCSYNFHASFAMAPAHERRQEDWAVFYDTPAYGLVRRAALNLGAPGDRRDANRQLWLAIPRPDTGLQLDCALDIEPGLGPDRVNADRVPIEDTDRPWLYGSAICGLRRLDLDLEPLASPVSLAAARPPAVDGRLIDPCWDGRFALPVNAETSTVYLRHDATNLYVAYRRPAPVDRLGQTPAWRRATAGDDAPVWTDDSFEVRLSDRLRERVAHLGLSASGARYDGLWARSDAFPVFDIPRLDAVAIDGDAADWDGKGFRVDGLADDQGNMRPAANLDVSMALGWSAAGLLMLVNVRDNAVVEYPAQAAMWRKDSIELFIAESRDSRNRFHLCVGPGADGKQLKARVFFWDRRTDQGKTPLTAQAAGARTADGYRVEILLPWSNLSFTPSAGRETALQVMINDADEERGSARDWFRAVWHPDGHTEFKPQALHRLRLAAQPGAPVRLARGGTPDAAGLFKSAPECSVPPLDIPRIDDVAIDGDLADWGDRGFQQLSMAAQDGTMRAEDSFDPSFRLAWSEKGLLLAGRVRDQAIVTDPDASHAWRKDSVEVFVAPAVGSRDSTCLTIIPPAGDKPATLAHSWQDSRKRPIAGAPDAAVMGRRTPGGYAFEALLPWERIGVQAATAREVAFQVFFNDSDSEAPYPADWFRVASYPQGHAAWNPLAYHRVRLATAASPAARFTRGERTNDELVQAAEPFPWPMPEAWRGKSGEDSQWNGAWTGAARADADAFACEMAIPWATLAGAGLTRDSLIIDFSRRGRVEAAPAWSYVAIHERETAAAPARPYTVRLHFAELRDVAAGARVFDVKLQGQTVLPAFDVAAAAGGSRRAITREFTGIVASTNLAVELVAHASAPTWTNAPILSGIEIAAEE